MILCSLLKHPDPIPGSQKSAWQLVEESQQHPARPVVLIPQPSHAVLAGDLAQALLPDAFGELPANIIRAIRMHDSGWGTLDASQIHKARAGANDEIKRKTEVPLESFLHVPSAEAVGAWKASVDEAEKIAPECGFIVSRHFSLLSVRGDRAHAGFAKNEAARRERILRSSQAKPADLERWTDALGFCDLLSLYLCSYSCAGVSASASLPRVHPSRRSDVPALTIHRTGEQVSLSEPLVRPGTRVAIHGLTHPAPQTGSAALALGWTFA